MTVQERWRRLSDEAYKDGRWIIFRHESGRIQIGWWCAEDNVFWTVINKHARTGTSISGVVAWINYPRDESEPST